MEHLLKAPFGLKHLVFDHVGGVKPFSITLVLRKLGLLIISPVRRLYLCVLGAAVPQFQRVFANRNLRNGIRNSGRRTIARSTLSGSLSKSKSRSPRIQQRRACRSELSHPHRVQIRSDSYFA